MTLPSKANNTNSMSQGKSDLTVSQQYLSHPDEPKDSYRDYLAGGATSQNSHSNPRNLFDDSNSVDTHYLTLKTSPD